MLDTVLAFIIKHLWELLIGLMAVWGAALSTYVFFLRKKTKDSKILVRVHEKLSTEHLMDISATDLYISAENLGTKTIVINRPGFTSTKKLHLYLPEMFSNISFPYELLPGMKSHSWIETDKVVEYYKSLGSTSDIKVLGFYVDELGNYYQSEPYVLMSVKK